VLSQDGRKKKEGSTQGEGFGTGERRSSRQRMSRGKKKKAYVSEKPLSYVGSAVRGVKKEEKKT